MTADLFTDPLPLPQKQIILRELRVRRVVCGDWFLQRHMPRYAARINELRGDGHDIQTVTCPYPAHRHGKHLASYELRSL